MEASPDCLTSTTCNASSTWCIHTPCILTFGRSYFAIDFVVTPPLQRGMQNFAWSIPSLFHIRCKVIYLNYEQTNYGSSQFLLCSWVSVWMKIVADSSNHGSNAYGRQENDIEQVLNFYVEKTPSTQWWVIPRLKPFFQMAILGNCLDVRLVLLCNLKLVQGILSGKLSFQD